VIYSFRRGLRIQDRPLELYTGISVPSCVPNSPTIPVEGVFYPIGKVFICVFGTICPCPLVKDPNLTTPKK